MRLIKMFGLAVVAAASITAFVGVTSASATTLENVLLCSEMATWNSSETSCPVGHDFATGTVIDALQIGTGTLLDGFFGDITCAGAHIQGTTTGFLAHGEITSSQWLECEHSGSNCTYTAEHLNWEFSILLKSGNEGYHLVISEKAGNGVLQFLISGCPLVSCTFKAPAAGVLFELLLETNDVVADVLQELEKAGGSFCPEKVVWHAQFLIKCLLGTTEQACWPRMEVG